MTKIRTEGTHTLVVIEVTRPDGSHEEIVLEDNDES